jgi:hypothetical protein
MRIAHERILTCAHHRDDPPILVVVSASGREDSLRGAACAPPRSARRASSQPRTHETSRLSAVSSYSIMKRRALAASAYGCESVTATANAAVGLDAPSSLSRAAMLAPLWTLSSTITSVVPRRIGAEVRARPASLTLDRLPLHGQDGDVTEADACERNGGQRGGSTSSSVIAHRARRRRARRRAASGGVSREEGNGSTRSARHPRSAHRPGTGSRSACPCTRSSGRR